MSKSAPVPLFNYKKRQRQALVSDPDLSSPSENKTNFQENSKANGKTSSFTSTNANQTFTCRSSNVNLPNAQTQGKFSSSKASPGLMDMSGKFSSFGNKSSSFSSTAQNKSGQSSFQSSSSGYQHATTSFGNTRPSRGRGFGMGQSTISMSHQGTGQNRNSQGRGQLKLNNFSSPGPQGGQAIIPRSHTSSGCNASNFPNGRQGALQNQQWGTNPASNSTGFSAGKQGQYIEYNPKSPFASKCSNRSSTMSTSAAGTPGVHNSNKGSFNKSSSSGYSGRSGQFTAKENSNPFNTKFEDDGIPNIMKKMPVQNQSKTKQDSVKSVTDTSMRIFTCPIASLKSWVGLKAYNGPVMFEIYGILDSATIKNPMGSGKEFMLRDDTDSIKCVFYEIDREMPRLTRGQVHRVVGVADHRRGLLQVVCVRPALKEERRVCQAAGAVSQAEMELLAAGTNEQ